jgi:RNA 2',3'-cyclic 3'-phosphodiesterase
MRIFIGIDISEAIRTKIARFMEGVSGFAPEARWVGPQSLHITLKFIGEQKPEQVEAIALRLRHVQSDAIEIQISGHGFFPTAKAPRVFWIGIHAEPELASLAGQIDAATHELGVPREERGFSPHLTLARAAGKSGDPRWRTGDRPNSAFAVLEKRLATMPELDFGRMTADHFILYQSQLSPSGSKYTKLEQFRMGRE